MFFRYLLFPAVLISLLLFSPTSAFADDVRNENKTYAHKWFLTLYGGPSAQPDLENVLLLNMRFEDDTYIAVAALAREFWRYENWIGFEVEGQVGKYFGKELSTQCYVANNDQFAIVAFRGSEIWKKQETFDLNKVIADFKADVDIRLTDWPQGGKVHRGFKEALEEVWLDILPYIRHLHSKGCSIWMTGHSLGAALATLCAGRYGNVQAVYTFGSPRVGNDGFKEKFDVKTFRIVNNDDIVARVPPPGAYVHVGELKFIENDGTIKDHTIEKEGPVRKRPDETYGQENTNRPKNNSFAGFVPAAFRDHVPLLYAVYLWNNIVENQN